MKAKILVWAAFLSVLTGCGRSGVAENSSPTSYVPQMTPTESIGGDSIRNGDGNRRGLRYNPNDALDVGFEEALIMFENNERDTIKSWKYGTDVRIMAIK